MLGEHRWSMHCPGSSCHGSAIIRHFAAASERAVMVENPAALGAGLLPTGLEG